MANFVIQTQSVYNADPDDFTEANFKINTTAQTVFSGLPNDVAHVIRSVNMSFSPPLIATPSVPVGLEATLVGQEMVAGSTGTAGVYTFGSKTLGTGTIYVAVAYINNTTSSVTGLTVAGETATQRASAESGLRTRSLIYSCPCTAATGDIVFTSSANADHAVGIYWWLVTADHTVVASGSDSGTPDNATLALNLNTGANDLILATGCARNSSAFSLSSLVGVTQDGTDLTFAEVNNPRAFAAKGVAAGGTPETVTANWSAITNRTAGVSVALRASA